MTEKEAIKIMQAADRELSKELERLYIKSNTSYEAMQIADRIYEKYRVDEALKALGIGVIPCKS